MNIITIAGRFLAQLSGAVKVKTLHTIGCGILIIGIYYAYAVIAEGQHQLMHY